MNLFFVDHCARMSGAQISLLTLVEDLVLDGHSCVVALAEDGPLVEELRRVGARVSVHEGLGIAPGQWPASSPHRAAAATFRVVREARAFGADVVHLNSVKALLTLSAAFRVGQRAPLVWSVRDIVGAEHFSTGQAALIRRQAAWWVQALVGNSESSLRSVREGRRSRPGDAVVHPGVGEVLHRSAAPADRRPVKVVMVGRLAEWKGQLVLLRAVEEMRHRDDVTVDIVGSVMFGEDEYGEALQEAAATSPAAVTLTGFKPDPGRWLCEYDVLVHASTKPEAFGRVVVEGMKAGLAVVAAGAGGPTELITHGDDGLLLAEVTTQVLAAELDRLVDDPALRARLGASARGTGSTFSRAHHLAGYLDVYREIVSARPAVMRGTRDPVTVSVVVPSYRRADSLTRTLASLERLDDRPHEVIVVAQPDDVMTRRAAADAGVTVALTGPGGLAEAMQVGAEAATGVVVAFTDDDAEPLPDWITRVVDAYTADPLLGAFGGRDLVVGDTDADVPSTQVGRIAWFGRLYGAHHRGVGVAQPVLHLKGVNMTVRRQVFDAFRLPDLVAGSGAQAGNELFVCLATARLGWRVVYDPELQVVHHAAPRVDGTARALGNLQQARHDIANVALSSMLFGRGMRRVSVPLFGLLVGERVRPGLVSSVVAACRTRDLTHLRGIGAGLSGCGDAMARLRQTRSGPTRRG